LYGLGGFLGGGHGDKGEATAPVGDLVVDYLQEWEPSAVMFRNNWPREAKAKEEFPISIGF
jgi:hypothetical protein